jgi:hypothetical protein
MHIACQDCGRETKCINYDTPQGDRDLCSTCRETRRRSGEKVIATSSEEAVKARAARG